MFNSIGLIAKRGDIQVKNCLEVLVNFLYERHLNIVFDAPSARLLSRTDLNIAANTEALGIHCDLIIIIGGDGTLLQAARLLAKHDVCLLGINLGRLGFLTDLSPFEIEKYLGEILDGAFLEEDRFLIYAEVYREKRCLSFCNALNDIAIHRGTLTHMLTFKTTINGHFVNTQRADGLVIATPTGSTAYALSAGGPLIHPSLNALVLVPICPHTLSSRPLVIDSDSCVQITLDPEQIGQAQLNGDGVLCQTLEPGDKVVIEKHQYIRLIHPQGHDHYATLRAKLDWSKAV
jgi:NAD+ kinase